jgi:RNA polymerase sigma factor (sigma-70 family)
LEEPTLDDVAFATLIENARLGDEAAVAALLGRFEPEVRTMVRVRLPRILRNQLDSMDIVQAIWTSVFAGKPDEVAQFTDVGQFRGFLAGVARNKVYEEHRRRTRTKKYDLGREERLYVRKGERDITREVVASDPTPSEEVQADDRLDQLTKGRTPEEVRVVKLRRQGLTFDEIAQRLGISERSVRRVIESIRERMEAREWR